MFSVGVIQPQLCQLSLAVNQVTNIWNSARSASASQIGRSVRQRQAHQYATQKNNATTAAVDDRSSVEESEKVVHWLNNLSLDLTQELTAEEILRPLIKSPLVNRSNELDESYVSSNTFFENINGFPESELQNQALSIYFPRPMFFRQSGIKKEHLGAQMSIPKLKYFPQSVFQQSVRGFKTDRADKYSGLGGEVEDQLPRRRYFKHIMKTQTNKKNQNTDGDTRKPNTKVQSLMSKHINNSDVVQALVLSFAEGYKSGDKAGTTKPKRDSWLSILGTVAIILTLLAIFSWRAVFKRLGVVSSSSELEIVNPEDIHTTFDDVKGCDEAKQELLDVVEFLHNPEKFNELGATLPKGVLLVGPPGTGKTQLARAVAGEAKVPFMHICGSQFDEMFVGTGARRVRSVFDAAKMRAPCVVFIDEIDAVGGKRTSSALHPYANQTINQLLSEMDGFKNDTEVIVLGATNKRENLDSALLRPGRFDVEVRVAPPDLKGRIEILELYMAKIKMSNDINVEEVAKSTTGCTGADLENIVNTAAVKAALDGDFEVNRRHFEYAIDKGFMGPEKKRKIPDDKVNLCTAYHEAGHTLVAYLTNGATRVRKVTIMPRGMSLGHTSFLPDGDVYNHTKTELLATIDVSMGGRVAEEIIYGPNEVTTGASNDFKQATGIATAMVKIYGMSEKIGFRFFSDDNREHIFQPSENLSPQMAQVIDSEITRLLDESYTRTKTLLQAHETELKNLAKALMEYETLDYEEVKIVINGNFEKLKKHKRSQSQKFSRNGSPVQPRGPNLELL